MQRLMCLLREVAIHRDQIARTRHLARNDDLVRAQPTLKRQFSGLQGGQHHALVDDIFGGLAEIFVGVFLHPRHDKFLIQGPAVDADADRFLVVHRHLADGRKLFIPPSSRADVAGIDAVFVERCGGVWVTREELVAVVVEVADERRVTSAIEHALFDLGHGRSRFRCVDGDTHHLRSGLRQFHTLLGRGRRIRRVGHRHALNDNRGAAPDLYIAHPHAKRLVKPNRNRHAS